MDRFSSKYKGDHAGNFEIIQEKESPPTTFSFMAERKSSKKEAIPEAN
jgi:hypothetical protein